MYILVQFPAFQLKVPFLIGELWLRCVVCGFVCVCGGGGGGGVVVRGIGGGGKR